MSVEEKLASKVVVSMQPPKMWKVVMLNDDYTPMDLVISLLMGIFKHSLEKAKEITLEIHNSGSGVAGVYTYEIAEQRALEATEIARSNSSPLKINVEQE
jgi:ATP-dependent Clp protease adaptor protein ClpS